MRTIWRMASSPDGWSILTLSPAAATEAVPPRVGRFSGPPCCPNPRFPFSPARSRGLQRGVGERRSQNQKRELRFAETSPKGRREPVLVLPLRAAIPDDIVSTPPLLCVDFFSVVEMPLSGAPPGRRN